MSEQLSLLASPPRRAEHDRILSIMLGGAKYLCGLHAKALAPILRTRDIAVIYEEWKGRPNGVERWPRDFAIGVADEADANGAALVRPARAAWLRSDAKGRVIILEDGAVEFVRKTRTGYELDMQDEIARALVELEVSA